MASELALLQAGLTAYEMNQLLLSSAYFPPPAYFSLIASAGKVNIEKWENYHKQTYRNRCNILGANGPLTLSIPVERGSFHKTAMRDIKTDDSQKWRQVHLRSIISAYSMAPYFEFYFDVIEEIINDPAKFLLDYNMNATQKLCSCLGFNVSLGFTDHFISSGDAENDFRYVISPKFRGHTEGYTEKPYIQVFSDKFDFIPGLSIIDMLLNNGPGTPALLHESLAL